MHPRYLIKAESKTSVYIKRALWILCSLIVVTFTFIIFYFNGDRIKEPLSSYLQKSLNENVTIEKVEFSPIYPGTLKLHNVVLNNTKIKEIYLELSIKDLLSKKFLINYLYLDTVESKDNILSTDFPILNKLSLNNSKIKELSLKNSSFDFNNLHATKGDLKLFDVSLKDDNFNAGKGEINLKDVSFLDHSFKSVSLSFELDKSLQKLIFKNLNAEYLGGTIYGNGIYDLKNNEIAFSNLNLENLILKDLQNNLKNFKISASSVRTDNLIFVANNGQLSLNNIKGEISHLKINDDISFSKFEGNISEIKISDKILFLDNKTSASLTNKTLALTLDGSFNEGKTYLEAILNKESKLLTIKNLSLHNNKIEIHQDLYSNLLKNLDINSINFESINLKDLELLSYIKTLPLSIKNIQGNINSVILDKDLNFKTDLASFSFLNFTGAFYSDLYINDIVFMITVQNNFINIIIPKADLRGSTFNLALNLNKEGQSFLMVHAQNFDLSALNCNLIPYTLSGLINLDVDIKGQLSNYDILNGSGKITLSSDHLLISKLGFDLINGGPLLTNNVTLEEFLEALSYDNASLEDLYLSSTLNDNTFTVAFNSKLISSELQGNAKYSKQNKLSLNAELISYDKDNKTSLKIQNDNTQYKVQIIPTKRSSTQTQGLIFNNTEVKNKDNAETSSQNNNLNNKELIITNKNSVESTHKDITR